MARLGLVRFASDRWPGRGCWMALVTRLIDRPSCSVWGARKAAAIKRHVEQGRKIFARCTDLPYGD